jgi:hypothetical protein
MHWWFITDRAAADNVAAAQVRLGRLVDQRATPAEVKPGDQMYLDASPQHSPPHQVPYKLANRWMGPFVAKEVRWPSVRLDLPPDDDRPFRSRQDLTVGECPSS